MPDKIKIVEIEIENYRQFNDKQIIKFPGRDEGFSVIIGENGAGKSNILNAINWCFYKKEPHQKKNAGKYIVNQQYMEDLKIGKTGKVSVKIKLQIDDTEFHISRILTITKNKFEYETRVDGKVLEIDIIDGYVLPAGTSVQSSNTTFAIMKKEKNQSTFYEVEGKAENKMNDILPEILAPYFLLDGEYLEKFWEDLARVKIGVEQISQLNLIVNASEHLSEFKTSIPKIGSSVIDSLTTEINTLEYWMKSCDANGDLKMSREMRYNYDPSVHTNENYHLCGHLRIEELEQDVIRMKSKLTEIARSFADSNIQIVEELGKKQELLERELDDNEPKLNTAKKIYIDTQIHNGPILFLLQTFQNLDNKVEKLRTKGELPYEAKMLFTTERLEMNKCICHTDLTSKLDSDNNETNAFRKNVENVKNQMVKDQGLDYALVMRDHFKNLILNDPDEFTKNNIEQIEKNYIDVTKNVKKISGKLKAVRIQLQTLNEGSEIEKLTENHKHVLNSRDEAFAMIGELQNQVRKKGESLTLKRIERTKELKKDERTKKIAFEQNVWLKLSKIMDDTLSSIKGDIREEVQRKTFAIFNETSFKEKQYDRFIINENYSADLIDSQYVPSLGSLSAGEGLFLALSFISALKEITGYRFPLVIDTPLGRVSALPRYLLSQALPKYLPNEQILFLATGTEFVEALVDWDKDDPNGYGIPEKSFAQLLEEQIKLNYHSIRHSVDKKTATIQDYIPLWERKNG